MSSTRKQVQWYGCGLLASSSFAPAVKMDFYHKRLERKMAEVFASDPDYYTRFDPERFRDECGMLLSIEDQMEDQLTPKKEGYV